MAHILVRRWAVVTIVACALAGTACKSEEEKRAEKAEKEVAAAAKQMGEAAAKLGANAAQLGAQGAAAGMEGAAAGIAAAAEGMKQAAAGIATGMAGAGGQKVELVDFRVLKDMLPQKAAGLTRDKVSGEKNAAMGFGMSQAKATYKGDDDARIEVKLLDAGGMGVALGAFGWSQLEIDRESDDEYERTTTIGGRKALEKYNKKSRRGELKVMVAGRYLVEIDGHDVAGEALQKTLGALDLGKLESLK